MPPDQYTAALRAIEVSFLTALVLTELASLQLPVSDEPGFKWTWVARENGAWTEAADIHPPSTEATPADTAGRMAEATPSGLSERKRCKTYN